MALVLNLIMPVESDQSQHKDVVRATWTRHDFVYCPQIKGHKVATRTGAKHADDMQTSAADIVILVPDGTKSFLDILVRSLLPQVGNSISHY